MKKVVLLLGIFLFIGFVSAVAAYNNLHLNIQVTHSNGSVQTGTFDFVFNISGTSDCANVVYSNSTTLTTDSRGIISYYLEDVAFGDYSAQYWLCYYRDGVLTDTSELAKVPYSFYANYVPSSGVLANGNMNLGGYNISTTGTGFFGSLGNLLSRITDLFTVNADISNDLVVNESLLFVDSTAGSVGVGTATPQNKLNILGDINATGNVIIGALSSGACDLKAYQENGTLYCGSDETLGGGAITGFGDYGYIPMWNGTNSLNNSRIFQFGDKIGIGTTSPQNTLNVLGDLNVSGGTAVTNANGTNIVLTAQNISGTSTSGGNIILRPATKGGATNYNGGVLIGYTTQPSWLSPYSIYMMGTVYAGGYQASSGGGFNFGDSTTRIIATGVNGYGNISFISNNTARMYIFQNGFVGINTTTPQNTLNVFGDANITGNLYSNGVLVSNGISWANAINGTLVLNSTDYSNVRNYALNSTGDLLWANAVNGTLALNSSLANYYLASNPFNFYNATTLPASSGVSGSGTQGYIPLWNGTTSLGNSVLYQNGSNIGIGTTSPVGKLDVNGNISLASGSWVGARVDYSMLFDTSPGFYSALNSNGDIYFNLDVGNNDNDTRSLVIAKNDRNKSGTALVTVRESGNVGIGTTDPSAELDVNGDIYANALYSNLSNGNLTLGNTYDGIISIGGDAGTSRITGKFNPLKINTERDLDNIYFSINGSTILHLDGATKYVGIGTTNPSYKLDISAGTSSGQRIITTNNLPLRLSEGGTSKNVDFSVINGSGDLRIGDGVNYFLTLLQSNGYFGINTITPQNTLNVLGDANITGLIYGNGSQLTGISFSDSFIGNYSDYLITKNYATNSTGTITWANAINGTLVLNSTDYSNVRNYALNSTGNLLWANVINGSVVLNSTDYSNVRNYALNSTGTITWANVVNGTLALNSSLANYYLASNPFGFYNSTTLPASSGVSGSGTYGYIPMWNGTTSLNKSNIFYLGNKIGIGTPNPSQALEVAGNILASNFDADDENTSLGAFAGGSNTGDFVTFVGYTAGQLNSGSSVTAVGYQAGLLNSGYGLSAFGRNTGYGNTGDTSSFFGGSAGEGNIGDSVSGLGSEAGTNNIGSFSTFVGNLAGSENKGQDISSVGYHAARLNTGNDSSFLGYLAGSENSGNKATGVGYSAATQNRGNNIIALGYQAGYANSGNDSIFIGYQAGLTETASNQFIVKQANINSVPLIQGDFASGKVGIGTTTPQNTLNVVGNANITGNLYANGQLIGSGTITGSGTQWYIPLWNGTTSLNNSVIYQAGSNIGIGTASPASILDVRTSPDVGGVNIGNPSYIYSALNVNSSGNVASFMSNGIAQGATSDINFGEGSSPFTHRMGVLRYRNGAGTASDSKIQLFSYGGSEAAFVITGENNVGIGTTNPTQKLEVLGNLNATGNITSDNFETSGYNVSVGNFAGLLQTGNYFTGIGYQAGKSALGDYLTAIGLSTALSSVGNSSTIIGAQAGTLNNANDVVLVGRNAGYQNVGNQSTAIGYAAGQLNTGNYLTALGYSSGYQNLGSHSNFIGYNAGYSNDGNYVTAIGFSAGQSNAGNNSIFIGYQAGLSNTLNNQFIIKQANVNSIPLIQGNFSSGSVGINTTTPQNTLNVNGQVNISGASQYLYFGSGGYVYDNGTALILGHN